MSVDSALRFSGDRGRLYGSSLKWVRLLPSNPPGDITLDASEQLVQFTNFPATSAYNLSKSWFEYDALVAAPGAVDAINCFWADAVPFDRLYFVGTSEYQLLALQYADLYSKIVGKATTSLAEYLNSGRGPQSAATLALAMGINHGLQVAGSGTPGSYQSSITFAKAAFSPDPAQAISLAMLNSSLVGVVAAAAGNAGTDSQSILTDQYVATAADTGIATATALANGLATLDFGNTSLLCQQAVIISARPALGGAGVALAIKNRIPMKRFGDTILAQNKNLYFGNTGARMDIYLAPRNRWAYVATAAPVVNIVTGAANVVGVTLSNFAIQLAVEQNAIAKQIVMDQWQRGGLRMLIPYPRALQSSLGQGLSATIQDQLSSGMGKNLLRNYFIPYHPTNNNALTRNTENVNGHKISQLQSYIDVYPLQDRQISCASGAVQSADNDWSIMKNHLSESAYPDGIRDYKRYWFWLDNHSGTSPLVEEVMNNDKDVGYPLTKAPIIYQVQLSRPATAAYVLNGVIFSVVQKLIQIGPDGTRELA